MKKIYRIEGRYVCKDLLKGYKSYRSRLWVLANSEKKAIEIAKKEFRYNRPLCKSRFEYVGIISVMPVKEGKIIRVDGVGDDWRFVTYEKAKDYDKSERVVVKKKANF